MNENTEQDRDFNKTVRLGTQATYGGRRYSVYCRIKYTSGELSICGVEGPLASGNALGGCGQIDMTLKAKDIEPAPGWTEDKIARFLSLWDRWHLNKMRAGSPAQEEWLRKNPVKAIYPESHYDKAKAALEVAGLQPDDGYSYGSAWCNETVPDEIVQELQDLPETDRTPAWV